MFIATPTVAKTVKITIVMGMVFNEMYFSNYCTAYNVQQLALQWKF